MASPSVYQQNNKLDYNKVIDQFIYFRILNFWPLTCSKIHKIVRRNTINSLLVGWGSASRLPIEYVLLSTKSWVRHCPHMHQTVTKRAGGCWALFCFVFQGKCGVVRVQFLVQAIYRIPLKHIADHYRYARFWTSKFTTCHIFIQSRRRRFLMDSDRPGKGQPILTIFEVDGSRPDECSRAVPVAADVFSWRISIIWSYPMLARWQTFVIACPNANSRNSSIDHVRHT